MTSILMLSGVILISPLFHSMVSNTIDLKNAKETLQQSEKELRASLEKVKLLSGILPICMHCKGIRDDKGYWNQLEKFIHDNSEAEFSHSICPTCLKKHYPDMYDDIMSKSGASKNL
jgi:hypothetical protein